MLGTSDLAVAAAAASVPGIKLNDGNVIPQIGLGLLRIENDDVAPVVKSALAAGYRHIDGAAGYNNEGGVGRALAETGFNKGRKRSHLWVTTKLRDSEQGYDMALAAFDRQLGLLQLEYVDMYMIHWPTPFNWRSGATWKAFTKLRDEGRVKTLGVCNFLPEHLTRLYEETGEWPAVNQIELHPLLNQSALRAVHAERGIVTQAYSPLGVGNLLTHPTVQSIAAEYGKTPAQVLIRWSLQLGNSVIPRSSSPERIAENLDVFGFELAAEHMDSLNGLDDGTRYRPDPATYTGI